jgi:hypothetical protein
MSSRYYEIWRRQSREKLAQVRSERESLESLMGKSKSPEEGVEEKLDLVSKLESDAQGLHEKLDYVKSIEKSREALKVLKELSYLALASRE